MFVFNLVVDVFGVLLSLRSIFILWRTSRWMTLGWAGAGIYFVVLFVRNLSGITLGFVAEYALVLLVAVIWIVAVVRDEPQAEPWWWPTRLGPTRAELKSRREKS